MSAEEDFLAPYQEAETEFTEKRSRFIGHIWRTDSEEEARQRIEETRKRYHDARHNCWAYAIHDGNIVRYSDDGEPQGTAGKPILSVFQWRGVTNACCVVTRYFGGVLLGTGGLSRAYLQAAKNTLDAAGIALVSFWSCWEIPCPYAALEPLQREIDLCGGQVSKTDYGARATVYAMFPPGRVEEFKERLRFVTSEPLPMKYVGDMRTSGKIKESKENALPASLLL